MIEGPSIELLSEHFAATRPIKSTVQKNNFESRPEIRLLGVGPSVADQSTAKVVQKHVKNVFFWQQIVGL